MRPNSEIVKVWIILIVGLAYAYVFIAVIIQLTDVMNPILAVTIPLGTTYGVYAYIRRNYVKRH